MDGFHLIYASEFRYLVCVFDEAGIDGAEMWRVGGGLQVLSGS